MTDYTMRRAAGHGRHQRHELPKDDSINITPLIDVVFQLLIFFMVASSLARPNQIELDLPQSSSGTKAQQTPTMIVTYQQTDGGEEISLNGEVLDSLAALGEAMRAFEDGADVRARVDLHVARRVPYEQFIALLDTVREAGYPKFSLLTLAGAPRRGAASEAEQL